jgi:hypothetical protein
MPTIFAANESSALVDGEPIEGLRTIEYRRQQVRQNIYALGSAERIGMTSGPQSVEGRLMVASTNAKLDSLTGDTSFQITAQLKQGDTQMAVTFDECFLLEKSFNLGVGGHGEAVYSFTATRVREELG